jgi:uncharacterized protein
MSHVEKLQSLYAAFGRGDVPAILAELAEDVEWDANREDHGLAWLKPRRGPGEVAGFFAALADWSFDRFEPHTFLTGGDRVAVLVDIELTHRGTGKKMVDQAIHLFAFDAAGKVASFRHFVDTLAMAEASRQD